MSDQNDPKDTQGGIVSKPATDDDAEGHGAGKPVTTDADVEGHGAGKPATSDDDVEGHGAGKP